MKRENFERKPKNAPTGQRELQKNLPLMYENKTTIISKVRENSSEKISKLLNAAGEIE